jgi:hypothetical protein
MHENLLLPAVAGGRCRPVTDLSAFSVDLMTAPEAEIPAGHAVLTMVDGDIVFRSK